jgi:hypothetical protein
MVRTVFEIFLVGDHLATSHEEAVSLAQSISGAESTLEATNPKPIEIQAMTIHRSMLHHLEYRTGPSELQQELKKWPNRLVTS